MRLALLLLVACGGGSPADPSGDGADGADGADGGTDGGVDDPSAHTYTDDRPSPALSLDAAAAGAQAGIDALAAIDPVVLYEGYEEAMRQGSPDCPGTYPAVGLTMGWANDCTTGMGWSYRGRSQLAWVADVFVDDQRMSRFGEFITNAEITHPGGAVLDIEGYGELRAWDDAGVARTDTWLFGTFSQAGDWLDADWLDAGASVSVVVERADGPDGQTAWFDGGLSRDPTLPDGVAGLTLRSLSLTRAGGACVAAGEAVVLGGDGARVTVSLAGEGATCAACGPATLGGDSLGEVCLDLDALLPEEPS